MPSDLDHAHDLLFHGKVLPARYARALADEITRCHVAQMRAEENASINWKIAVGHEARALAISTAAQAALDRWEEHQGCLTDDNALSAAVWALQAALDAKHDSTPLADLVPAVALYRIAWKYSSGDAAAIEQARAALFLALDALSGKRDEAR